ncbi:hypothetical protein RUW49_25790, partial [Citrobacter freundii]|uniref:hypothetical protein n=1 Tax=Citrobacter freundii TaxID=546 RepID=UPI0028F78E70
MGSCAAPSAKGDDKFITTDYLQQCPHQNHISFHKPALGVVRNVDLSITVSLMPERENWLV